MRDFTLKPVLNLSPPSTPLSSATGGVVRKNQVVFRDDYYDKATCIASVESDISSSTGVEDDMIDDDFVIMMNTTEERMKIERSLSKDSSSTGIMSDDAKMKKKRHSQAVAAGVTTGAFGLMFGGPIIGALVGFGTTAVAKMDQHSVVGDAVRGVGDLALVATDKVKEIDEKHQISNKTSEKVKEIDLKLHVSEKSNEIAIKTVATIEKMKATENYHIVQHHVGRVGNTMNSVSNKVNDSARGIIGKMINDFQTHVLLLDDDAEFDKQIAYLYMQRTLQQEEKDLLRFTNEEKKNFQKLEINK